MVVQHNLTAMNSNRMLGITTSTQAKSTEKLSSGYKINRAADDAAGLAISEKMRKQIRGLTQASLNAQDGISAVQTAEGALTEVHDMLQRMNELAVKADNGTLSQSDRQNVQDEVDQLVKEIDRVSETTKFNETYLLKGSAAGNTNSATITDGAIIGSIYGFSIAADGADYDASTGGTITLGNVILESSTANVLGVLTGANANANDLSSVTVKDGQANVIVTRKDGTEEALSAADFNTKYGIAVGTADGTTVLTKTLDTTGRTTGIEMTGTASGLDSLALGTSVTANVWVNGDGSVTLYDSTSPKNPLMLNLHVGADSDATNKISLAIDSMDATTLGIRGAAGDAISVKSEVEAGNSINTIAGAISKVSRQRSALGAVQNRLEHTINNLDNVVENTTAAESQIRDTDMATEMVKYSNNSILAQAGQAMLAQSNQANQGVLSLLQ